MGIPMNVGTGLFQLLHKYPLIDRFKKVSVAYPMSSLNTKQDWPQMLDSYYITGFQLSSQYSYVYTFRY